MKTIEDRLRAVVALIPPAAHPRVSTPLAVGETADSRLVEAVQALANAEGLVWHTKEELAQAKERLRVPVARQSVPESKPFAPANRITTCTNLQQQTAFWRSLTPLEKIAAIKGS